MKILQIISTHKKNRGHLVFSPQGRPSGTLGPAFGQKFTPPARNEKRVEAIIRVFGLTVTRHINVPRDFAV